HQVLKRQMLNYVARRRVDHGAPGAVALEGEVLTLTFARRFAEYKRPVLLLADVEHLARLVNAAGRGLQLIFAGKAHPRDDDGKRLIQRSAPLTPDRRLRARVVFVEDSDFSVARSLLQAGPVGVT